MSMSFLADIHNLAGSMATIAAHLATAVTDLHEIAVDVRHALQLLSEDRVVGIGTTPGTPTDRPLPKESVMAKAKVKFVRRASAKKAGPGGKFTGTDFSITDIQDDVLSVFGVDAAGAQVDISAVATLTPPPTSSDTTVVTLDTPSGMTVKMHALKPTVPGTPVIISFTATWNDGSIGPFTFDLPCDVTGSAATGLVVVPGTPTAR
jgi:hypothetical protein